LQPTSPTSLSDPGSEVSGNSIRNQADHQSLELLNKRMADLWSRTSSFDATSQQSAHGDESACGIELEHQHSCQPVESMSHSMGDPGTALLGHLSANGSTTSRSSLSTWQGISEDVHETLLRHQLESPDQSHQTSSVTLHQLMHQPEQLQYPHGCHTWQAHQCQLNVSAELAAGNDVMSALSGIPEQVQKLLESTAHGFAEELCGEVAAMGNVIRYSGNLKGETELAVEKLECIPGLILNSFEGKLMRVKDRVRRKVNNVIEDLEDYDHFKEEVVKKLYTIPEEVVNIATEAMEEVSKDSQIISSQQIDDALLSVPQACVENRATLFGIMSSIVATVPDASSSTSKAVHDTAIVAVEQAVAKICDTFTGHANELVADQLLRIKEREGRSAPSGSLGITQPAEMLARHSSGGPLLNLPETVQTAVGTSFDAGMISSAAGSVTQASNPGSMGHPELCPRPCLYFARGECVNENNCDFCHLPHPKRPSHLDKRHREMLKRMPLAESVSVAMPVLQEKVRSLSLGNSVMELLDKLEEVANCSVVNGDHGTASSSAPPVKRSVRSRNLQGAMRGITLRSLLTALHRSGLPGDLLTRAALADLLRSFRSIAPDFPCDLNSEVVDSLRDLAQDD